MATPLPTGLAWRKSSFSTDNGACVEIAHLPGGRIAIRDSKNPAVGHLTFSSALLKPVVTAECAR